MKQRTASASGDRGTCTAVLDMASTSQNTSTKVSYAQMIQNVQVPTKEQAIVLDSVEGIPVSEYTLAIGKIIDPAHIRFVSRISHGRVCFYLNSKNSADMLIDKKVNIGPHTLTIRPLVSRAKRIILSNVCPIIPNEIILGELDKVDIKPKSQITYIRAGINNPGFSHVLSFRRQMYIDPEDLPKLPPSISTKLDNTAYHIYLSAEKLTCFLCNEEGHTAKHCKNIDTQTQTGSNESQAISNLEQNNTAAAEIELDNSQTNSPDGLSCENDLQNKKTVEKNESVILPPPAGMKRPLSSSTSTKSQESHVTENLPENAVAYSKITENTKVQKKTKKLRTNDDSDISLNEVSAKLSSAESLIAANADTFPLDLSKFTEFLVSCYGQANVQEIAEKYTTNLTALKSMLQEVQAHVTDKNLRSRIKRISNRLDDSYISDTQSEASASEMDI